MNESRLTERERESLRALVHLYGIEPTYRNSRGETIESPVDTLLQVLAALGAPVARTADLPGALEHRRSVLSQRLIEPTCVLWEGSEAVLELRLLLAELNQPIHLLLEMEGGERIEASVDSSSLDAVADDGWVGGHAIHRLSLRRQLGREVPVGLHTLVVETGERSGTTRLVAAPTTAYEPDGEEARHDWGIFLPLHALRTRRSWGTGDFRDLSALLSWTAAMGGSTVGTLPMLSTFLDLPFDPSPYAPVSRLFWNELYLDVERAPEMQRSEKARKLLDSPDVREAVRELREAPRVEYRRAAALKRPILEALALTSLKEGPSSDFRTFLEERPEVEAYARFRATVEQRKTQWREWPPGLRDSGLNGGVDEYFDARAEHYHIYVQWLAHRQLRELAEEGRSFGAGLYLDLPLGAHPDGFDVWRHRDIFVDGMSGGAPPDDFFSRGQNWGFPPLHPEKSRLAGHGYTIDSIRTMMRFADTLRLDHVMSLHRLYWVPRGLEATEGVYVRYPADELYAILCLESRRHRTVLVGEDLGTVPDEVREEMERHALRRMYVVPFELPLPPRPGADADSGGGGDRAGRFLAANREGGGRELEEGELAPVPRSSVTSLNTHDMPTFAGHWLGRDIRRRAEAGLLDASEVREEEERREVFRTNLQRTLLRRGALLPDETIGMRSVLRALLRDLAGSPTRLLLVALEDLWLEEEPHNLPGTEGEENWRRKAAHDFETFTDLPEVVQALGEIDRIRSGLEHTMAKAGAAGGSLDWRESGGGEAEGPAGREP